MTVSSTVCAEPPEAPPHAADQIGQMLLRPPQRAPEPQRLNGDTRIRRRWSHGPLHENLPAMTGNVIITYYGSPRPMAGRTGSMRFDDWARPGTMTVIPEGHDGRRDIDETVDVSHVYLTRARLQACADTLAAGRRIELVERFAEVDTTSAHILQMLGDEAQIADFPSRVFVEQAIDLLCTQLVRTHSNAGTINLAKPRRGLAAWQVKRVSAYIDERLGEDISLDDLAGVLQMSRFHFCTAFRLATGRTPHKWLTTRRMDRARELLARPALPITRIALEVGYGTPSAFSATFRRAVGQSPSDYRRRL